MTGVVKREAFFARLARRELPPAVADRWLALLRPSFQLRALREDEPVVGQLGGVPILPEGLGWPHWEGHGPLAFIAEIDCGELPSDALSLPRTGTLSFFCWDEQLGGDMPWRAAPGNRGAAQVVYIPAGVRATERPAPAGIVPYPLVEMDGELVTTGPAWDSPAFTEAAADLGDSDRAFLQDPSNADVFRQALWEIAPGAPGHRIGGHADPFQEAVELDVARALLGSEFPYDDPAIRQEALGWSLLAQFGSDSPTGMRWGDCGALYWLLRTSDLAARRFDAAAFTWQS